jgi:RecA/RadA recombinase
MKQATENLKKKIRQRRPERTLTGADFLSTGSMMLNLALTDHPERGFAKGYYYLLVGDTKSGKTFLTLTCLAEAAINPHFKEHRFIHDNVEQGALMDFSRFFGPRMAARVEAPARLRSGRPVYSRKIEDFYYHLDDACKVGRPFIYILDSQDCLDSDAAEDKFEEQKRDSRAGKDTTGSYGDGKAKVHSGNLRRFILYLQDSGSIILIVNQTRNKIGRLRFPQKTRSGGDALPFYATMEIWSSVIGPILKTVRGKKRSQGVLSRLDVHKNRVSGKDRSVVVPIYTSYGIDDIGSCVDYLIDEAHWKTTDKGGLIKAPEFKFVGQRERLIQHILQGKMQKDLGALVQQVWEEIEDAVALHREPRYT